MTPHLVSALLVITAHTCAAALTRAYIAGDLNGDGGVDYDDYAILMAAYGTCEGDPDYNASANLVVNDPGPQCIDFDDLTALQGLTGLEATGAIRARFTWDAENRLAGWEPLAFVDGARKVEFKYDYLNRRVERKVYSWDEALNGGQGDWALAAVRRWPWFGWLPLVEYSADPDDSFGDHLYFYDGGGNVGQLIASASPADAATIAARYEYDPFGKPLLDVTDPAASGPYAAHNPFRFSTKFHDAETGLHASIFRYYDPRLGRWINRDPIQEAGGENLYAFVRNRAPNAVDALGWDVEDLGCENRANFPPDSQLVNAPGQPGICRVHVYTFDDWAFCNLLMWNKARTKYVGFVVFPCSSSGNQTDQDLMIEAAKQAARAMAGGADIVEVARAIQAGGDVAEAAIRTASAPLDSGIDAVTFIQDPSMMNFIAVTLPGAAGKATKAARPACKNAEKAAARKAAHHIATNKNFVSKARGGPWSPKFKEIFDKAGMELEDDLNKVLLPKHSGTHPQAYHEAVFERLTNATKGTDGDAYRAALQKELEKMKKELADSCSDLSKLLKGE